MERSTALSYKISENDDRPTQTISRTKWLKNVLIPYITEICNLHWSSGLLKTFNELGFTVWQILFLVGIIFGSFFFTQFLIKKYIIFAKKRSWVGRDIHKKTQPEVAESGGIAFLLGILPGLLLILLIFPEIRRETIAFLITLILSGLVGFMDDRITLSSLKKIALMILTGIPLFIMNLDFSQINWPSWLDWLKWFKVGFIHINDPVIPIIGQTRLTLIYQLAIPIIIMVLTNGVNMLEGYNGEGSGTSLIVIFFLFLYALIARSSEGLIYSLAIIGGLTAFFKFNKYPAKVFPGDVGTLSLGATIACIALLGSLEVAMFCAILVHIFNGFYVIASLRGLRERHTIKTHDIIVTEYQMIKASRGKNDHLTLPRLILAERSLTEPLLVRAIWSLAVVGGLFGIVAETVRQSQWTPLPIFEKINGSYGTLNPLWILLAVFIVGIIYAMIIIKFKAIRIITVFMVSLLIVGIGLLILLRVILIKQQEIQWLVYANWLIAGIFVIVGFIVWYILSIKYFWYKISKLI